MRRWRRLEWALLGLTVALKLSVVARTWGRAQGFDAGLWLDTFDFTHWFEPLLAPRALAASYHPPLSYLLTRLVFAVYPHAVEASQIVATASVIGALLAWRAVVRRIGWLWSVPGLCLVYGVAAVPLIVWQAVETSYDSVSLFWFLLALAMSVRLHWEPLPAGSWRRPRFLAEVTALGLVLAAGMLTKYSGLMAFPLPFLVIAVRRGWKRPRRALLVETVAPVAAVLVACVVVGPLFVKRYYRTEHLLMPSAMEWLRGDALPPARAQRDKFPLRFLGHMLDFSGEPLIGSQVVTRSSLPHSVWLQTWARDSELGPQPPRSLGVSGFYIVAFSVTTIVGLLLFLARGRRLAPAWRHLGWILLLQALFWLTSALYFGWNYPMFDWQVFKAKYVSPYVLWIVFAAVIPLALRASAPTRRWRWIEAAALVALLAFIALNHLLPVY